MPSHHSLHSTVPRNSGRPSLYRASVFFCAIYEVRYSDSELVDTCTLGVTISLRTDSGQGLICPPFDALRIVPSSYVCMYVHAVVSNSVLSGRRHFFSTTDTSSLSRHCNISHCVYPPSNLLRMNFLVDAKILKSGEESGRPTPDMAGINE